MDRQKKKTLEPMTSAVMYHDKLPGGGEVWRAIAAFDSDAVTEKYIEMCNAKEPGRYRASKFFT